MMPRSSRSRFKLSEEEKKKRRREQKKLSMRRARSKLDAVALEERRKKDRERYHRKKEGLIKTIKDFRPRDQRQVRKIWREKAKLRREKEKIKKTTEQIIQENTPPSSPCPSSSSSFSRISVGKAVAARNKQKIAD
ncbi:unnamed protein product [Pieris macdunnoughi]|uniref:Uncharacterized protein n=1 Tax=Pieris macdunnoughi TaxID=345717 RepID=A0A821XSH4_9NEOP|nr:unnamed protein product [Pieris macdunnoughi]